VTLIIIINMVDDYGEWIVQYLEHQYITFDKCNCCGWKGLSEDVRGNQCPRCGSEDTDDIDAEMYE
jgi:predicted Zn-ribbon and HTH transcriptional regulator